MEVSELVELARIEEVKILHNVRLLHQNSLAPVCSKENVRVKFEVSGELKGSITCYLCLDLHELTPIDKNYLFPLFVESMNILIGRQISLDEELAQFSIKLSSPLLNMNSSEVNTELKITMQKYELALADSSYRVLTEYRLETLN